MEPSLGATRADARMRWQHAKDAGYLAASCMRILALITLDSRRMSVQGLTTRMPTVNDRNAQTLRDKGGVMKVQFSVSEECLEELTIAVNDSHGTLCVHEGIVRLTTQYRSSKDVPHLLDVHMIAGVVIAGMLVELRQYCGTVWEHMPGTAEDAHTEKTRARAKEVMVSIRTAVHDLGLSVRKGLFLP